MEPREFSPDNLGEWVLDKYRRKGHSEKSAKVHGSELCEMRLQGAKIWSRKRSQYGIGDRKDQDTASLFKWGRWLINSVTPTPPLLLCPLVKARQISVKFSMI